MIPRSIRQGGIVALLSLAALAPPAGAASRETTVLLGRVELGTGIRMHYAEQGPRTGPAVILLHGFPDSWVSWSLVLPLLPDDLHVLAPDLRGHGDTDRPRTGYTMAQMAADVIAFMDAMGITQATLVGHSMGAFIAEQVARTVSHRVTGLVLVGAGTHLRVVPGILELQAELASLTDPVPEEFMRAFQLGTLARPVPVEFLDRIVAESRKPPVRVLRAVLQGMLDMPLDPGLEACDIPTLIVWGEEDAFFPRSEQETLRGRFVNARLSPYPGAGHSAFWEDPDTFAREVASFVQRSTPD